MGKFDFRGSSVAWGVERTEGTSRLLTNTGTTPERLSSQNAIRHQISESFYHTVIPHLSSFICSKWNGLKVYQLLCVCYLLSYCHNMLKSKKKSTGRCHKSRGTKKKKNTYKDLSKETKNFNRCLESRNCISFAIQRDFHQQIKDLLRSLETSVVLWHAERDVRIFPGVVLAHSWSIRLTLNSLKEIRLAHIQMNISAKTHSTSGPRRSVQEPGETVVREDSVMYKSAEKRQKRQRGREGEKGWGKRQTSVGSAIWV